jgi:hypothetical protein
VLIKSIFFFQTLVNSFTQLLSWIDGFLESQEDAVLAKRASRIVIEHFVPFMQTHFKSSFSLPLQEKWHLRDEGDSVTPFEFKLDCAAYEPTPQKEIKADEVVNGDSMQNGNDSYESNKGQNLTTEPKTESKFGVFASTFASQMNSLWHDDVNIPPENETKTNKKNNLNERFEKTFSARSSQEPQKETNHGSNFLSEGITHNDYVPSSYHSNTNIKERAIQKVSYQGEEPDLNSVSESSIPVTSNNDNGMSDILSNDLQIPATYDNLNLLNANGNPNPVTTLENLDKKLTNDSSSSSKNQEDSNNGENEEWGWSSDNENKKAD